MDEARKTLIVIPARGGSKRLPRKNLLPLAGKPLISWTIEAAIEAGIDSRIVVTSDDDEILAISEGYRASGVIARKRPPELATDTATTADALIDVIETERASGRAPESIILLQPTSPLRDAFDIRSAMDVFEKSLTQNTVVSVCEVDHPTAWTGVIEDGARLEGIDLSGKRSQDYQKEYRLNGAVYVASVANLLVTKTLFTEKLLASVMPRERSFDIDDAIDFRICECFLQYDQSSDSEAGV